MVLDLGKLIINSSRNMLGLKGFLLNDTTEFMERIALVFRVFFPPKAFSFSYDLLLLRIVYELPVAFILRLYRLFRIAFSLLVMNISPVSRRTGSSFSFVRSLTLSVRLIVTGNVRVVRCYWVK